MSPNDGKTLIGEFSAMVYAVEHLPQVEQERDNLRDALNKQTDHSMALEDNIIGYKAQIEALQSKVRATEAERDDAELRFLELDEKTHKALDMLEMVENYAKDARLVIEPPKPQPEPVMEQSQGVGEAIALTIPEAVHSIEPQPQGQGEGHPTNPVTEPTTSAFSNNAKSLDAGNTASPASQPSASRGQGEVNPIPSASATADQPVQTAPQVDTASDQASPSEAPKPPGPYTGKSYKHHPVYVPYQDWINGGGTDASYHS